MLENDSVTHVANIVERLKLENMHY